MPRRNSNQSKLCATTLGAVLLLIPLPLSTSSTQSAQDDSLRALRVAYPKPNVSRPRHAGEKFVDPTFGTEIMRATDESEDQVGLSTYYSHWPTFNCDNTFILIRKASGGALIKHFDANNFSIGPGFRPGDVNISGK